MHYWEISMIFFCPGNLDKDLHTTTNKKTLSEVVACMPCVLLPAIHFIEKTKKTKNQQKKKKKDRKKENFEAKTNLKKLCSTLPTEDSNFTWI